jgi:BRCT domain type II-containing protein
LSSPSPVAVETVQRLIIKAVQEFDDYQRLTSQGKHGEAGQKLEQHKRTLEELKRLGSKQP